MVMGSIRIEILHFVLFKRGAIDSVGRAEAMFKDDPVRRLRSFVWIIARRFPGVW
jgi:hypothetical protein